MVRAKDYGTAVEVQDDYVMELKADSFVTPARPETMRWIALFQFSLLTGATAMSVGAHTVIVEEFRHFYGLTIGQVDFLNTIFLGSYLLIGAVSMRIFTRAGLKGGMYTASSLFLAGSTLKVLSVYYRQYWLVMFGQFLTAFAINFAMAGPSLLSATWFPATERTFATTIASQADNIGIACSFLFPSVVITPDSQGEAQFLFVFGTIFLLACVDSFLTFFVIPAKPKVPLAIQAAGSSPDLDPEEATKEAVHPSFQGMFRSVSHSTPYKLLSVAAALSIAVYWTYSTLYAQIFLPYGISEAQSGTLGAVKILLSIIPATLIAKYIDRSRNYKTPLIIANAVAAVCFFAATMGLEEYRHPYVPLLLIHIPMGIAQSVIMPVSLEYMVEITFPVDPSVSAGVFMYALRILCTIIVSSAPVFLPARARQYQSVAVMSGYTALAAIPIALLLFVRSPLRRYMAEHGHDFNDISNAPEGGVNGDATRASEMTRLTAMQP